MSTILNKANQILQEKQTKIIPNNIKDQVQIFDILGDFVGSGNTGAYKVSSIAEMEALEGMDDGDYCVINVEQDTVQHNYEGYEFDNATLVNLFNSRFAGKTYSNFDSRLPNTPIELENYPYVSIRRGVNSSSYYIINFHDSIDFVYDTSISYRLNSYNYQPLFMYLKSDATVSNAGVSYGITIYTATGTSVPATSAINYDLVDNGNVILQKSFTYYPVADNEKYALYKYENNSWVNYSDADAVPINIRSDKTAYVNGVEITGTLPVVTYPVDPNDPENWDYQFVASTTAKQVTRDNVDYILGTYQVSPNNQPDSWMFEGNRKMKMGIPFNLLIDTIGLARNIRKGASIYGLQGTWTGEESEDTNIYNVSSVIEMNALTGMTNDSICIVSAPTNTLPTGYTELVYIESTGNEYMDTNIVPKYLKSEFKFAYKDHKPFGQQVFRPVIGARQNDGGTYASYIPVYPSIADATHSRLNCSCASTSSVTLKTMLKNSEDEFKTYTILFNDENNRVYLDGDLIATFSYFDVPDITLTATLFGLNYGIAGEDSSSVSTNSRTTIKLYYMKLWNKVNNTLVRDFIPCIQDSDNAIGLYDKVSNTFFGNLGTGGFIAGPKPATNTVYKYNGSSWVLLS